MANDQETVETNSMDAVIERVIDIIGDREEALRWLGTPVQALGYETPIACMGRSGGKQLVLQVLDRLQYGIW